MDHRDLDGLIDGLDSEMGSSFGDSKKDWRSIWDRIKEIGAEFKATRYPTRDEKDRAWSRFQSAVERVKNAQSEDRQKWEDKRQLSLDHKDDLLSHIHSIDPPSGIAEAVFAVSGFGLLDGMISSLLGGSERDDAKDDLTRASAALKEGWALFSRYKSEMLGRDKQEVFRALTDAQSRLNQGWAEYKSAKQSAHEARQRAWEEKRRDREAKHQAWEQRVQANVDKLETRLDRLRDIRSRKQSHISELQGNLYGDCSDNYRARVEGWIYEEEGRLQEINDQIDQVKGWLSEAQAKLR